MPPISSQASGAVPVRPPFITVLLAWLVPGCGHLLLRKYGRAVIVFVTVAVTFGIGLLARGPLFHPGGGTDVLSRLIQYGGFLGDLANGFFYFLTTWFGYAAPQVAGYSPDYGSKLLVAAGLLNILAMVDAYEITMRQKD
ncbi:MAG TPA: DUF6677 family protein [Bryobacteraceae bacterium]